MEENYNVFEKYGEKKVNDCKNIFADFLVREGLYKEIEITKDNILELADLVGGDVKIDVFCPKCGNNRVFTCEPISYYFGEKNNIHKELLKDEIKFLQKRWEKTPKFSNAGEDWYWTDSNERTKDAFRLMVFKFHCAMDENHKLDYIVTTENNTMKKIGQFPTIADLSHSELNEYKKVTEKEDLAELKKAIGLYSHGIGIGSFVYLRRILERMIISASEEPIKDGKIDKKSFTDAKIAKRIKMLSDYLPKMLVENTQVYGIVSKGIHEMSEEECKDYFPVLRGFIMLILKQREQIRREKEEERNIEASLDSIVEKIKQKQCD